MPTNVQKNNFLSLYIFEENQNLILYCIVHDLNKLRKRPDVYRLLDELYNKTLLRISSVLVYGNEREREREQLQG